VVLSHLPAPISPECKAIVEVEEACEARICLRCAENFFVSSRAEKHGSETRPNRARNGRSQAGRLIAASDPKPSSLHLRN